MQTGLLNSENMAQVLRGIAQKRQNGCLEIIQGDEKLNLIFSNGKIVDAHKESENSVARAARRIEKVGESGSNDLLRIVVKHDVLNFLFSIDPGINSIFTFKNYMPEFDKDYAANISVGQYLLDKASLDSEIKRFDQLFQPDSLIIKLDLAGLELSEEESILYESLKDQSAVSEIFQSSVLSRYHIIISLLSFYERAIIEIEQGDGCTKSATSAHKEIINVLEDSSARPFVEKELNPHRDEQPRNLNIQEVVQETPALEIPEAAQAIRKSSQELKSKQAKPKNTYKFREEVLVPRIVCIVYITIALIMIAFTWGNFIKGF